MNKKKLMQSIHNILKEHIEDGDDILEFFGVAVTPLCNTLAIMMIDSIEYGKKHNENIDDRKNALKYIPKDVGDNITKMLESAIALYQEQLKKEN